MPVETALWRVDDGDPRKLAFRHLEQESRLEALLAKDISVLGLDLLLVGRQVLTDYGKRIDLLGIDMDGDLHVIELKRDRTPRDVVAQCLDYGSWIQGLTHDEIADVYTGFAGDALEAGFEERFGGPLPESINEAHHLVIVASELDPSTERIVGYLRTSYDVPLNALFFRYFEDEGRQYLARSWLLDPVESIPESPRRTAAKGTKEPWNGQDFYAAIGDDQTRRWADMMKYGFISAGGGRWYSRTLESLFVGARVFACMPGTGYVGVGNVTAEAVPVKEFVVRGGPPLLSLDLEAEHMGLYADDPEKRESVVGVEWIETVPKEKAIWEKGMYANQNSATKLRNRFTLERLVERFGLDQ